MEPRIIYETKDLTITDNGEGDIIIKSKNNFAQMRIYDDGKALTFTVNNSTVEPCIINWMIGWKIKPKR